MKGKNGKRSNELERNEGRYWGKGSGKESVKVKIERCSKYGNESHYSRSSEGGGQRNV
jgi:hypothetical protein